MPNLIKHIATLILGLALITLNACGSADSGKPADNANNSKNEKRIISIGASAAPDSLDPTTASAAAIPEALLYNVYETLVKIDFNGAIVPLLAEKWDISEDRKEYTFHLVKNATFSNGSPVNADAVVKSMLRIKNDDKVLPTRKKELAAMQDVTALDEHTVKFTLSHPSNDWFFALTSSVGIIFDPKTFDTLAANPVGSGPFEFDNWKQGESLSLRARDDYWGTPSKLGGAIFKYYTDPNAENAAMLSGSLDVVSNVAAPQALDQFSDKSKFVVLDGDTTGEVVLGFNHNSEQLKNKALRQAINYAIDRKALRDAVWAGHGSLIGSMVPPTDPWYEDLFGLYPFDPAKARKILVDAGLTNVSLRLRIPTLPYAPPAANYIASQLADVGIKVSVDELEFPATWVDEVMKKGNYDMTIVAHVEQRDLKKWADPDYYWHYNNSEFQELITKADQGTSEEQIEYNKKAAKILAEDAAADFLWLLPHIVVTKPDITGVYGDAPSLSFDLTQAAIK